VTADKNFKRLVRSRARRTGESYTAARHQLLRPSSEVNMSMIENPGHGDGDEKLVEVRVDRVLAPERPDPPIVILKEALGERTLVIFIGTAEALAIRFGLERVPAHRPMTHDAIKLALETLGGQVRRIVIGFQPDNNTYTADIAIVTADGEERHLDWRPSDAIALAVRSEPAPALLVPSGLLAGPPANVVIQDWPQSVRFRCSCGGWMFADDDATLLDSSGDSVEIDVTCSACRERRHIRFVPPSPVTFG
jgi:bifunctional DNase/RNase